MEITAAPRSRASHEGAAAEWSASQVIGALSTSFPEKRCTGDVKDEVHGQH